MAGVDPVSLAVTGLTTLSSLQQARAQARVQTDNENARRRRILAQREIEERREAERLKAALATRRARFGASGIAGAAGGLADAVLDGLRLASRRDVADRRRLDDLAFGGTGGNGLFDDRLGLAANLLDRVQPRLPRVSLFETRPRRSVRTPTATI